MSIVTLSIPIKNPNFKYNIKFENICKFSIDKFMVLFIQNPNTISVCFRKTIL